MAKEEIELFADYLIIIQKDTKNQQKIPVNNGKFSRYNLNVQKSIAL